LTSFLDGGMIAAMNTKRYFFWQFTDEGCRKNSE